MNLIELSPEGNFESWEISRLKELRAEEFSKELGQSMLYENDEFRLWDITLKHKERLTFRRVVNDFSYTCITDGFGVIHLGNGKIQFGQFKKGDVCSFNMKENEELILDVENTGLGILKFIVTELKLK